MPQNGGTHFALNHDDCRNHRLLSPTSLVSETKTSPCLLKKLLYFRLAGNTPLHLKTHGTNCGAPIVILLYLILCLEISQRDIFISWHVKIVAVSKHHASRSSQIVVTSPNKVVHNTEISLVFLTFPQWWPSSLHLLFQWPMFRWSSPLPPQSFRKRSEHHKDFDGRDRCRLYSFKLGKIFDSCF